MAGSRRSWRYRSSTPGGAGSATLFSRVAGTQFSFEDAETLELLAGIVAATLVGLERAQVRAVTLTARASPTA